jgi:hypothetical protein
LLDRGRAAWSHFDAQFQWLRWPGKVGTSKPYSFTLPIALPVGGASLDYWRIEPKDLDPADEDYTVRDPEARETYWYELGTLAAVKGLWLHRIGACGTTRAADYRITLQGHLIEVDGRWIAYW